MKESELILRHDGAIYHLALQPEELFDTVITVGDPERVGRISAYFDQTYFRRVHREIITHGGRIGKTDVLVMSTGMGTDNIEIVLNELDALANIDFDHRRIRDQKRVLRIIRVGTSGSLVEAVPVGTLLASVTAIGMDTLMQFYQEDPTDEQRTVAAAFRAHMNFSFTPYMAGADARLLQVMGRDCHVGNTLTCPGFYLPQGRVLRAQPARPDYFQALLSFRKGAFRLTNMEMETAAYYALGKIFGHEVVSLNAILANRITGTFAKDPVALEKKLIEHTLERLADL